MSGLNIRDDEKDFANKYHIKNLLRVKRFIGLSLGGGKSDKACLAVIDYYPDQEKIFLKKIYEKIKNDESLSADAQIIELVRKYSQNLISVTFDVPTQVPLCMTCNLKCPGFETCGEPHIRWMWAQTKKFQAKKKPKKIFTPYTQRSVDLYLQYNVEEKIPIQHALGANIAPHLARAHFLQRQITTSTLETNSHLSVWRVGLQYKVMKRHLRNHRHSVMGSEARSAIIKTLSQKNVIFLYQQDMKAMVENNHAFEAFISAFSGFLNFKGACEPRPDGFPSTDAWIVIPKILE